MMSEIDQRQAKLRDQWKQQKSILDLALRYRVFEQDCATVNIKCTFVCVLRRSLIWLFEGNVSIGKLVVRYAVT